MPVESTKCFSTKKKKKKWSKNSKNYRTRKFLATNLTPWVPANEDELQSNFSSDLYLTFISKPEEKIYDVAFKNIFSVLKKTIKNARKLPFFYQFDEPSDLYES